MAKRVVGYARVSTTEQASGGVSLASQEARIRAACEAQGYTLVGIELDVASGKSLARDGLQRALTCLKRRRADALMVVALDRLTRSLGDWTGLLAGPFARAGLISLADHVDVASANGRMLLNVRLSVAQHEREILSERTSAALQTLKAQGKRVGAVPYGMREVAGQLVEDPAEAAIVTEIRALKSAGASLRAIVGTLAERGRVGRTGRPLAITQVRNVLVREAA